MDRTYCIFGDSVIQAAYVKTGWVEQFRQFLEEKYRGDFLNVFNLGIGGNTSGNILQRFASESSARKPTDIIFAMGINDSGYSKILSKPIVEENKFAANLEELISMAKKYCQNITFIGLALGDDSILKPFSKSSTGKSYLKDRAKIYDRIINNISEKNRCKFVYLMDKLNFEDFQDGLHPNEKGHRKIFEIIKNNF